MANTVARLNQPTTWTPAGTGDTITCTDISKQMRFGVQVDCNNFSLDAATVAVTLANGATKTVSVTAGTGSSGLIGDGFSISSIAISGIAAGTYTVTFGQ